MYCAGTGRAKSLRGGCAHVKAAERHNSIAPVVFQEALRSPQSEMLPARRHLSRLTHWARFTVHLGRRGDAPPDGRRGGGSGTDRRGHWGHPLDLRNSMPALGGAPVGGIEGRERGQQETGRVSARS